MAEKEPLFTVTDRRKFTTAGELRPGVVASEVPAEPVPGAPSDTMHQAAREAAHPDQSTTAASPAAPIAATAPTAAQPVPAQAVEAPEAGDEFAGEEGLLPEPTAAESAEQHAAYQESARGLDELVAKQNPKARAAGPMTFDRLVQSIYMTAAIQLGAGGQPGEQPRVDILGARQSIDMLTVLGEKTKGNLTENEQRLLQNALFELRMSFLEITNAIATSAQGGYPPGAGAKPGFRPGGR
jgi:hypothetical protein